MQQKPLNNDENLELWMFFISGLSKADRPNISQFKFKFYDGTGAEFPCISDYSIETDGGSISSTLSTKNTQLKIFPAEPIPPDLKEEPPHPPH